MASKSGAVRLAGRFGPGDRTQLVKVRDESVLRAEGGEVVDEQVVGDDGVVEYTKGVEVGGRYFIVGNHDGFPLEVRVRGNERAEDSAGAQAPVGTDRVRLSDGSWLDEVPEREDAPFGGVVPGQHQVPKGTVQRSDTPRGTAHPVDPSEPAPYARQEDVPEGTVQRSATDSGRAEPIDVLTHPAQADVKKGTLQRSATELGTATPIPKGDAIEAQRAREAASQFPAKKPAANRKRAPKPKNKRAAKRPAKKAAAKTAAKSNPKKEK